MINQKIKVRTENEEQSRNVQETLFKHGIKWVYHDDTVVRNTNSAGLVVKDSWYRPGEMAIYVVSGDIELNDKSFASYDDFMKQYGKVPHKHAELIKAWADGAEIQYKCLSTGKWTNTSIPAWEIFLEYRIEPDIVEVQVNDGIAKEGDTVYWLGEGWKEEGPEEFIFDIDNDPKGHYWNMKEYPHVYSLKKPVQRYTLDY